MAEPTIEVKSCIKYASDLFSLDPIHLLVFAKVESNFDPRARNPSSYACGLFQFLNSTAREENIDPFDVAESAGATAKKVADSIRSLERHNIAPTTTHLYLCHQQGQRGFSEIYNALNSDVPLSSARIRNMTSNLPKSVAREVKDAEKTSSQKAEIFIGWWDSRIGRAEKQVSEIYDEICSANFR